MLFIYDIVLIGATYGVVNTKLEVWRWVLESKEFRLNTTQIEYLEYNFSDVTHEVEMKVTLGTQVIYKIGRFKYLGSLIKGNGHINDGITHYIGVGWIK